MNTNLKELARNMIEKSGLSDSKISERIIDPKTKKKWSRAKLSYYMQKADIPQGVFDLIKEAISTYNIGDSVSNKNNQGESYVAVNNSKLSVTKENALMQQKYIKALETINKQQEAEIKSLKDELDKIKTKGLKK